jgi:hypothetical protein
MVSNMLPWRDMMQVKFGGHQRPDLARIRGKRAQLVHRTCRITLLMVFSAMVGGCVLGAAKAAPVDPVGRAGLKPVQRDDDAGLVSIRSGFDLHNYAAIEVVPFVVTDTGAEGKDDVRLSVTMPGYFQSELVARLQAANLFGQVTLVRDGESVPQNVRALRLEGRITKLNSGDDTSAWVPFAGWGRLADPLKVQIESSLIDIESTEVMVVTADRRQSPNSGFQGSESYMRDSFEAMARDLVKFLERLAKGEVRPAGQR